MTTFEELGLDARLIQATDALGFKTPTPIQEQAIPVLLSGTKDLVGLAQTGTGKTAAFGLPLLQLADEGQKHPQALVVCPTRELCLQIVSDIEGFKKFIPGMHVIAVYGGTSIGLQIRDLKRGVQIVVATPGRLIDLIERKAINLEQIKYVVLDEADEMLNMGFQDDIEFILQNTPKREATWLFSACTEFACWLSRGVAAIGVATPGPTRTLTWLCCPPPAEAQAWPMTRGMSDGWIWLGAMARP